MEIKGKAFLAPMAGFTDIAYRVLCKKYGAAMVFSEMVNATAVCRDNQSTLRLAATCKEEKPVSVQLFGSRTDQIAKAATILEPQVDAFDFNFGCPDQQIVNQGAGAALLKRPSKIKEIISAITDAVSVPVSGKIRIGINNKIRNPVKTAKMIEAGGAWAVGVHGRTLGQGYAGAADWTAIKDVKDSVSISVIGNGDVVNGETAQKMLTETGCDYIMVGRAAMGDPSIFKRINHYLKTGEELPVPEKKDKIRMLKEYLKLAKKFELVRFQDIKQHSHAFLTNFEGAVNIRREINQCADIEGLMAILK
ncbi:MAG: tRNA dihydrouridine synthase DusB [Candidatus Undinarchaeales archaeon]|jgi:nifR3 family TIM-barrel protein|nr:tRNA dihydrouridine synthase DusB [Candidatus Undinarchaeales archaeon]